MRAHVPAPRWALALVAGTTLTVAAVAVVLALAAGGDGGGGTTTPTPAPPGAAALGAYTAALRGPTAEGGQVVEEEMKPSVAALGEGRLDAATLAARARSWKIAFARVRTRLDAVVTPPGLEQAHALFDAAVDGYARAADMLLQAAGTETASRQAAVDAAVAVAREADATYDRAAAIVQAALRAAGLPPDIDLPDPSPAPAPTAGG